MKVDGREAKRSAIYLPVSAKFLIALIGAIAWMGFSIWAAGPWLADLKSYVGTAFAIFLVYGIAIIPGFMNAFMAISLILDKRPPHRPLSVYPPISILIAAYNEEASIADTLRSLSLAPYDLDRFRGEAGGEVIATGTPEEVADTEGSFTGQFLREVLPAKAAAAA